jgi:hypothetical protein
MPNISNELWRKKERIRENSVNAVDKHNNIVLQLYVINVFLFTLRILTFNLFINY